MSPAACAWEIAASGAPFASHHAAARRLSSGTSSGSRRSSSATQEVSELVVVPVPLAPPIERDDEQVRPRDRLELARRSGGLEHRVAQRPAHPVEDRGPRQEADVARAQPREVLEVEVVGHESVVAANAAQRPALRFPSFSDSAAR